MEILVLTDIHLDTAKSCGQQVSNGLLYCDTYPKIYELLLEKIQSLNIEKCIYLGDTPAHGENENFSLIREVLDDINCHNYALGNNDASKNYEFDEARIKQFETYNPHFAKSGMFLNENFADKLVFIGLNSVLFRFGDEHLQLVELRKLLQKYELEGKEVIVGFHIPPGTNSLYYEYWNKNVKEEYKKIVLLFQDIILCELSGHYHTEYYRKIGNVPGFVNPGISPSNGGFPGFRVYNLSYKDGKYKIEDYTEYYCNLNEEYPEFRLEYQFSNTVLEDYDHIDGKLLKNVVQTEIFWPEFNQWRYFARKMNGFGSINEIVNKMK